MDAGQPVPGLAESFVDNYQQLETGNILHWQTFMIVDIWDGRPLLYTQCWTALYRVYCTQYLVISWQQCRMAGLIYVFIKVAKLEFFGNQWSICCNQLLTYPRFLVWRCWPTNLTIAYSMLYKCSMPHSWLYYKAAAGVSCGWCCGLWVITWGTCCNFHRALKSQVSQCWQCTSPVSPCLH